MRTSSGAIVADQYADEHMPVTLGRIGAYALPTVIRPFPNALLSDGLYTLEPAELRAVEASLRAVLDMQSLLQPAPRLPRAPAGVMDYPRWGEIYYGPPPSAGLQAKRYVVVSGDVHNRRGRCVTVRTTSQPKRDSVSFPLIEGGAARACCGDLTTFYNSELAYQPDDGRPDPSSLDLDDMIAIARGIKQTHSL